MAKTLNPFSIITRALIALTFTFTLTPNEFQTKAVPSRDTNPIIYNASDLSVDMAFHTSSIVAVQEPIEPTPIPTLPSPTPTYRPQNTQKVGEKHSPTLSADVKILVKNRAATAFGWSGAEWEALNWIIEHESGWNPKITNKSSGACGLFQALPCSKIKGDWTNIENQMDFGLNYIKSRYGSPTNAKKFWQKNKWY